MYSFMYGFSLSTSKGISKRKALIYDAFYANCRYTNTHKKMKTEIIERLTASEMLKWTTYLSANLLI